MKLQRTHIVAFANQKGGCGKTTSAVSVAAALAMDGYTVCLVDTDQQCNASSTLGIDSEDLNCPGSSNCGRGLPQQNPSGENPDSAS